MVRYERFNHDLRNKIWTNRKPKDNMIMCCQNTFEWASLSESYWQGKQTIPYLLMTTLKIKFYENIKSVLVLVNHHFLIIGGNRGEGG